MSIAIPNEQQIDKEANWTTPIVSYLKNELLPKDKENTRKLRVRAVKFVLMDEVLYKRSFSQLYLRCLTQDKSYYVMRDVHEKACGNHSRARFLVDKIIYAGYYWPTIQADYKAYIKACDKCQRFNNIPRRPSEYLTPVIVPWPFAQWGLNILSPFPIGNRQMKCLVARIDYFTKWVEAKPFAKITEQNVRNFVRENII